MSAGFVATLDLRIFEMNAGGIADEVSPVLSEEVRHFPA